MLGDEYYKRGLLKFFCGGFYVPPPIQPTGIGVTPQSGQALVNQVPVLAHLSF